MSPIFKFPVIFSGLCLLCLFCCVCSAIGETASAIDIEPANVKWNRLSYQARSIFGKVRTNVHAQIVPVEDVSQLLMQDPAGEALQPSGDTAIAITVNSNIEPLFGTDEILTTQSWFDAESAAALQRIRVRLGKDKWQKSYRFTKKGVYRMRRKPRDANEEILPLDRWTKVRNHFYAYPEIADSCRQVLEPTSLLYLASAIDLRSVPMPVNLCVFNKKQLHLLNVSVGDPQPLKLNFVHKEGNKQVRIKKKIDAVKLSFAPSSMAPDNVEMEAFSFLGLKGEFDIFLDDSSRIPVQISGRIAALGKVVIVLQEVEGAQTRQ